MCDSASANQISSQFNHLRRCNDVTSTFKMAAIKFEVYFRLRFLWRHAFKKVEISPSFCNISQFTAEIELLPVSEKGRQPCWNYTSGFDVYSIFVISVSFCIGLTNFTTMEPPTALIRCYGDFLDGGHGVAVVFPVLIFPDSTRLRRSKSICVPNFD